MKKGAKIFLTAEWRYLAMLNYEVTAARLAPWVPRGTELDFWEGKTFVSLVAFLFLDTRVFGMRIPFHVNFEEVNLRFYVRRQADEGWRRGVVFIRELVPRPAVAWVARRFYGENYLALPMSHRLEKVQEEIQSVSYGWRFKGRDYRLRLAVSGPARPVEKGSLQEFITEHYWGYARGRDGTTTEYRVEHPRWRTWEARRTEFEGQAGDVYRAEIGSLLDGPPASAWLAEGSAVSVYRGTKLSA